MVRRRAAGTGRLGGQDAQTGLLPSRPRPIIDVWLFRDKKTATRNTRKSSTTALDALWLLLVPAPGAHHEHRHRGGTLGHEIVHPFMRAISPIAPPGQRRPGLALRNSPKRSQATSTA